MGGRRQEMCSSSDTDSRHELRRKLDSLRLDADNVWTREFSREPVKASLVSLSPPAMLCFFFSSLSLSLSPFFLNLFSKKEEKQVRRQISVSFGAGGGGAYFFFWQIIKIPYLVLCVMLDKIFDNRPISRFWFLETVARMPYFSYISMLHLYETLGWFRVGASVKRVHFAEEWNEFHHLLIMESLGGDQKWLDRFMAQHAAVIYYWILVIGVQPSLITRLSTINSLDSETGEGSECALMQMNEPNRWADSVLGHKPRDGLQL